MNVLVLLFFLHNIVATAYLGGKFVSHKNPIFRNFGIALLLNCVAFTIWSLAIIQRPQNLEMYVTYGVVFFIAALVALVNTAAQNLKSATRGKVVLVGALVAVVLFYLRTFMYPSQPAISAEGFFFFNVNPLVQVLYIAGLIIASLPAINLVASKFKGSYSMVVRLCFTIEVIGGVILITSTDAQALYLMGWVMGIAYFALWAPLLFKKDSFPAK